ncbi:hypothetical protein M407DRAFT_33188 [Tulasnella calospora MUT 4182]|uniref:Uncharacterized protein n=1 Tax=Tulasnella calospora MUT 4182 TaxID=1051891 RepID=A0A0C3PRA8_9AGAM|nr:hypothetical protein M407DRAFT_33188 [Tulasnella calospora MUT 4182]
MDTESLVQPNRKLMFFETVEELLGQLQIPDRPEASAGYADIYHGVWINPQVQQVEVAIKEFITHVNLSAGVSFLVPPDTAGFLLPAVRKSDSAQLGMRHLLATGGVDPLSETGESMGKGLVDTGKVGVDVMVQGEDAGGMSGFRLDYVF